MHTIFHRIHIPEQGVFHDHLEQVKQVHARHL